MERVIRKNEDGDIACNDMIIYPSLKTEIGKYLVGIYADWEIIKPKYYKYKDDDCLIEIWYDGKGIILDNGNNRFLENGFISNSWSDEHREEISYKQAMWIIRMKQDKDYGIKDLMSKDDLRGTKEQSKEKNYIMEDDIQSKQNNNGGASDWYALPKDANTLQDLIEHRNMNGSVKDIFKACYRLGIKTEDELRDANKMAYYSLREIGRISGRKDYITIAKELMGKQAIEKD